MSVVPLAMFNSRRPFFLQCHQSDLSSHSLPYVLHYRPFEGSIGKSARVISKLHGFPDDTWDEPNPDDPLTVMDKVRESYKPVKLGISGQNKAY